MAFKEVKILVNGEELEINEFVQSITGNTIEGIISSLRIDSKIKTIEIKVVKNNN